MKTKEAAFNGAASFVYTEALFTVESIAFFFSTLKIAVSIN